eukprot:m.166026 g.166026  ORF g.166026 m.166026 type:complete len:103 (+) comp38908_c1_seq5:185-493(+)
MQQLKQNLKECVKKVRISTDEQTMGEFRKACEDFKKGQINHDQPVLQQADLLPEDYPDSSIAIMPVYLTSEQGFAFLDFRPVGALKSKEWKEDQEEDRKGNI